MDFNLLPNEILKTIIMFLDKKDAKNVALASRRLYNLAATRLWSKTRYPNIKGRKSIEFLRNISHLPIYEMYASNFSCSPKEIVETIPNLKILHIDRDVEIADFDLIF